MLPIKEGCTALIINSKHNTGSVVVGKLTVTPGGLRIWGIDRLVKWYHFKTGAVVELDLLPEANLMRTDGHTPDAKEIDQYSDKPFIVISIGTNNNDIK